MESTSASFPTAWPPIRELAPDIQKLLRVTRLLPGLETLPVALARAVYAGAAMLCNPPAAKLARMQAMGDRLYSFEPRVATDRSTAYFFIHGGGWTLGSPRTYRSYCSWLAARTGAPVFAVDYRRAPEHPYPAALDDCVAVYADLRQRLSDACRIRVVGDSAGAQLSLSLCHRLHSLGAALPDALFLHYPVLDKPGLTESYQTFAEGLFLSSAMMHWFWSLYQPVNTSVEFAALEWKDFSWLPPVSLALARHDVLFDEGYRLGQKLQAAGKLNSLHIEEDLPHAYINLMKCPSVMMAMERQMLRDAALLKSGDLR